MARRIGRTVELEAHEFAHGCAVGRELDARTWTRGREDARTRGTVVEVLVGLVRAQRVDAYLL